VHRAGARHLRLADRGRRRLRRPAARMRRRRGRRTGACGRRRDDARCGTEATVNRALPRYNPAMAPRPVMLAVALAVSACAAPGPRPPALAPDELLAASRSDPSASVDIVSRDA